jgi:hypothetical protein
MQDEAVKIENHNRCILFYVNEKFCMNKSAVTQHCCCTEVRWLAKGKVLLSVEIFLFSSHSAHLICHNSRKHLMVSETGIFGGILKNTNCTETEFILF